jgi:hypothetical protein
MLYVLAARLTEIALCAAMIWPLFDQDQSVDFPQRDFRDNCRKPYLRVGHYTSTNAT